MEIEIGRIGRFTSRAGKEYDFTAPRLSEVADGYDPQKFDAPLCIGHPATNSPAYGWVKGIRFDGDRLLANPHQVDPGFAKLVQEGKYKKISPAFWPPNDPLNPTKGKWSLRHVAFLGAHPPAITGLKPVNSLNAAHFASSDDGAVIIEFAFQQEESMEVTTDPNGATGTDSDSLKKELKKEIRKGFEQGAEFAARENQLDEREKRNEEREKRIEAREAQIRTDEITEFAAALIKEGQLLAPEQDGLVAFMAALNDDESIEFGAPDKRVKSKPGAWLRGFLKGLPKRITRGELAGGEEPGSANVEFSAPDKAQIDAERFELHRKALNYQAKNPNVDYVAAVKAVGGR